MKKLRLLLSLLLALCLLASTALAQPRYPAQQGTVTDSAAVLSAQTVSDLNTAADKLKQKTGISLSIVTVDFLDGSTMAAYGEGLRDQWDLGSKDALLLLSVGEDQFGLYGGKELTARLDTFTQQKLLTAHLQTPFLAQDYDGALRAFIPALVTECAKAWNTSIDLGGLLGEPETTAAPFDAQEWLQQRFERLTERDDEDKHRVMDEDEDTGISLGKVILTIFLLWVIFGKRRRRRSRGYHPRVRSRRKFPFVAILAALGLWKLWDKD